ncbi:hypothetical protein N7491_002255 [Penicillium cf. griseofulvum]|uniref:Uncharacterized protein n=1 Tax=Penicillium cf. griseofulvum TaxID=2972120 RepID=A0A9W9MTN4_9EURO|nr:hypothetical protein N7472_003561 [Penicillium cf. griseofulvum]KAJ5446173.1 hypothetical protein N7491_002255 [Penicillium cf. griseofulvum]KAJ5447915.1 hypothetical protein N7445_002736 [Penicillium cf. griseofulvum]
MVQLQLLLNRGAEVNAGISESRKTAFMLTAENGHLEVMRQLIDGGADVEAELAFVGKSAFRRASQSGHTSIVQFLLEQSAQRNIPIPAQQRLVAVSSAIGNHSYDVVKLLLDGELAKSDRDGNVKAGLETAALNGDLKMVELLDFSKKRIQTYEFSGIGVCDRKRDHYDLANVVKYLLGGVR